MAPRLGGPGRSWPGRAPAYGRRPLGALPSEAAMGTLCTAELMMLGFPPLSFPVSAGIPWLNPHPPSERTTVVKSRRLPAASPE